MARLSFCRRSLSFPIETPNKGRRGCSRMTVSPMASGRSRGSAVGNAPGAVVGPGGRWPAAAAWWVVAAPRGGWRPPRRSARGWMAAWTKTPARCGASHRLLLPVGAPSSPPGLWHWPRAALLESSTLGLAAADAPAAAPSRCCSCSAASASSRRGHHEVNESCAGSMAGSVPGPLLSCWRGTEGARGTELQRAGPAAVGSRRNRRAGTSPRNFGNETPSAEESG